MRSASVARVISLLVIASLCACSGDETVDAAGTQEVVAEPDLDRAKENIAAQFATDERKRKLALQFVDLSYDLTVKMDSARDDSLARLAELVICAAEEDRSALRFAAAELFSSQHIRAKYGDAIKLLSPQIIYVPVVCGV